MEVITHKKHATNISPLERTLSMMAGGALTVMGLRRWNWSGFGLALIGGEMIRRGAAGHSYLYEWTGMRTAPKGQGAETTSVPYELGVRVDCAITIDKPRQEVYRFWQDVENFPRFMRHLVSVRKLDDQRSRWIAKAPAGGTVAWEAEIHNQIENELIAWRSLPGSKVDNAGSVQFRDAPAGKGTEVIVELQYNPPGGLLGALAAKLWGEEPTQQIREDLRRLKQLLETGEVPSVEGQPSGRAELPLTQEGAPRLDEVEYASQESFPASDPPSWNR